MSKVEITINSKSLVKLVNMPSKEEDELKDSRKEEERNKKMSKRNKSKLKVN